MILTHRYHADSDIRDKLGLKKKSSCFEVTAGSWEIAKIAPSLLHWLVTCYTEHKIKTRKLTLQQCMWMVACVDLCNHTSAGYATSSFWLSPLTWFPFVAMLSSLPLIFSPSPYVVIVTILHKWNHMSLFLKLNIYF